MLHIYIDMDIHNNVLYSDCLVGGNVRENVVYLYIL